MQHYISTFITLKSYRFPHCSGKCADVLARDDKVVEECEDEVEDEASPDRDVIENCPVGCVKCHLN